MKITKILYQRGLYQNGRIGGQARILVDDFPNITFVIELEGKTTKTQVLDELKAKATDLIEFPHKNIYDDLELSKLIDEEL